MVQSNKRTSFLSGTKLRDKSAFASKSGCTDIVEKVATKTRTGYIPQMRKTNQDSSLTLKDFAQVPKLWMLGVMDGHGAVGHQVSQYVKV